MAFFQRLIAELERNRDGQAPGFQRLIAELERKRNAQPLAGDYFAFRQKSGATTEQMINVPKEVLQFAPKELRRQHQTGEDRVDRLETEIQQWRDRFGLAEMRLRVIEKSIQQIAADFVRIAPRK